MFPAVKEFKSFQWHSSSHTFLTRKALRHADLQHLPQASFSPHKLHHPTPLEIPPSRAPQHRHRRFCFRPGKASANCCFLWGFPPRPGRLGATASGWTPLFLRPRHRNRSGGNLQAGLVPKPTSSGWESPGSRELSLIDLLIAILLCVKGSNIPSPSHQEKTQWFVPHRCAGETDASGSVWHWLWSLAGWMMMNDRRKTYLTCSCQYLQLHSFWPNPSLSLSLCKFSTIFRHVKHMSNSQIFVLFKSLVILVQTWIKQYFEWLNHAVQMFSAVKEFKLFQWHPISHKMSQISHQEDTKTLRHTDLQHLPQASFSPHKLHHPTLWRSPPAGRLSTAAADVVVGEAKALQTVVFFEAFRQGLAVSGRQHRDGRPFFYGQGTGTDLGEIYRWGSSNQHQADGNHQAVDSVTKRKRTGSLHTDVQERNRWIW